MEKFQKISSRIIIILALLWILAVSMGQLSVGQSYMGIGAAQCLYRHPKHYFAQLGAAYRKNAA